MQFYQTLKSALPDARLKKYGDEVVVVFPDGKMMSLRPLPHGVYQFPIGFQHAMGNRAVEVVDADPDSDPKVFQDIQYAFGNVFLVHTNPDVRLGKGWMPVKMRRVDDRQVFTGDMMYPYTSQRMQFPIFDDDESTSEDDIEIVYRTPSPKKRIRLR